MKNFIQKFGLAIAAMAVIFTGCKDDQKDPVVITFSPAAVEVAIGSTTSANILTGEAPFTVSNDANASATIDGNTINITGIAVGAASIKVTGKDNATANLAVAISAAPANAPVLSNLALEVEDAGGTGTITISGGTPGFTATSEHPNIATASVSGTTVTVIGHSMGTTLVTVKGSDNASATFAVSVTGEQIFFGPNKTQIGDGRKSFYIEKNHTIKKEFILWWVGFISPMALN